MSPTHSDVTTNGPGPAPLERCTRAHREDPGIRAVHDRLGDKWSLLVIVELAGGPLRFRQLQRAVDGISQRMLTLTVRRLERDGLVRRTVYPTVPARVDYRLTEMGASLTHLLKALADWSVEHREDIARAQLDYDRTHPGRREHETVS
ncbi:transcriptional regulator [Actinomyces viscosus]|uniref:Uncharacterized HTH-type transcriptional regulator ytcD n=1 Tax=Actinomyces viscosus TaxID=1656 RepID=A0A3S4VYK8_ACTVI|nr:helix-turn-helix domain-containing protein [Actinomyces viscosus]TFH51671.1 transcriptional regulator [Actinomyces viscosus]VEI17863.1 Uncharacterized HTH-type transcriptional regulator ytcD [Actinomyces viscosus]